MYNKEMSCSNCRDCLSRGRLASDRTLSQEDPESNRNNDNNYYKNPAESIETAKSYCRGKRINRIRNQHNIIAWFCVLLDDLEKGSW